MTYFKNFINDEEGQDLVEYALLLGFVAAACLIILPALSTKVQAVFTRVGTSLT